MQLAPTDSNLDTRKEKFVCFFPASWVHRFLGFAPDPMNLFGFSRPQRRRFLGIRNFLPLSVPSPLFMLHLFITVFYFITEFTRQLWAKGFRGKNICLQVKCSEKKRKPLTNSKISCSERVVSSRRGTLIGWLVQSHINTPRALFCITKHQHSYKYKTFLNIASFPKSSAQSQTLSLSFFVLEKALKYHYILQHCWHLKKAVSCLWRLWKKIDRLETKVYVKSWLGHLESAVSEKTEEPSCPSVTIVFLALTTENIQEV